MSDSNEPVPLGRTPLTSPGHFVLYENPQAFASDLVETFRRIGG
ncbi:hypothetical protein [Streptomyces sp. 2A115]